MRRRSPRTIPDLAAMHPAPAGEILLDVLQKGLVTLLCGSAASTVSAKEGFPYANPQNKFWSILADTGLTPHKLSPPQFQQLADHRIGLTDLNKTQFGSDASLSAHCDDIDGLLQKVALWRPRILAFTAKRPAQVLLKSVAGIEAGDVGYGLQSCTLDSLEIFILPSTSGAARGFWDPAPWYELAMRHFHARG